MRKEDFTETEWNLLREAPHWAGIAVMVAGSSGVFGSVREAFAVSHSLQRGSQHASEFIRSMATRDEMDAADREIRAWIGRLKATDPKAQVIDTTIEKLAGASRILASKSTEAVETYRQWVLSVANDVANAAKEGAVLGFGGTRVSSAEHEVLQQIDAALQGTE